MKSTAEQIQGAMRSGFDRNYYVFLYKQMRYAFGWPWADSVLNTNSGFFPFMPDIMPYTQEVGLSRKIQAVAAIALPRIAGNIPKPVINGPGLNKIQKTVLEEFLVSRSTQTWQADGNWGPHFARAFLDGDQLGIGFVRFGLKLNPKTKKTYLDMSYQPSCQTLWDNTQRDFTRARWVSCAHYLDEITATDLYGKEAQKYLRVFGEAPDSPRLMRIFEYYDIGLGSKGDPTYAIIPDDLDQKPLLIKENPFGVIPVAHNENYWFPGTKYPIGRVVMQMPTQEMLNQHERRQRLEVQHGGGYDLVHEESVDSEALARVEQGEAGVTVRVTAPMSKEMGPPVMRIPNRDMSSVLANEFARLTQQFHMEAGISELDSGNLTSQSRTLGEVQLLQNKSDVRSNWASLKMIEFYQRAFRIALQVAKVGDVDPLKIDFGGVPVDVNTDDVTMISQFIPDHFDVLIDQKDLTKQDDALKKAQERQDLMSLAPFIGNVIDPKWFATELLKSLGVEDIQEAMPTDTTELQSMAAPQQAMPA